MNHIGNRIARECRAAMRKPIYWQDGEAEKLIADAIAQGRVTQLPSGYAAYSTKTASGDAMRTADLSAFGWRSGPRGDAR